MTVRLSSRNVLVALFWTFNTSGLDSFITMWSPDPDCTPLASPYNPVQEFSMTGAPFVRVRFFRRFCDIYAFIPLCGGWCSVADGNMQVAWPGTTRGAGGMGSLTRRSAAGTRVTRSSLGRPSSAHR
jgi:hypothetical protein